MLKKIYLSIGLIFFVGYYLQSQIIIGSSFSYNSINICNQNQYYIYPKCPETNFSFSEITPGYNFSIDARGVLINIYNFMKIGAGTSLGYEFDHIKKVGFTNLSAKDDLNTDLLRGKAYMNLHYLTNNIYVNIKVLNFLYLEGGFHNRYLLNREFPDKYKKYKNNETEKEYNIPRYYYDLYWGFGLNFGNFILKFTTYNFNKIFYVQYFDKNTVGGSQSKPVIHKFHSSFNLTLSIPIKNYKTNKFPIFSL